MELLSIKELAATASETPLPVEIHAQLTQLQKKTTRNNKPYLEVELTDSLQSITVKIWEDRPCFTDFLTIQPRSFIALEGFWIKNAYGLDSNDLQIRLLTDNEIQVLLLGNPELREKQDQDWKAIVELVGTIHDPRLKSLSQLFCQKYQERFRRTAAARHFHHARRGGLVEHVSYMMQSANQIATVYTDLNRDLILTGCLFHDCGKLWENCFPENDFTMPYSETTELLGHISFGIELVNKLWQEIMEQSESKNWQTLEPASAQVRIHLLHLIASHHGSLEFGSPVLPKTPEAVVLHYLDNLDAKLEMFRYAYEHNDQLAPRIYQRKSPLESHIVEPLSKINEL